MQKNFQPNVDTGLRYHYQPQARSQRQVQVHVLHAQTHQQPPSYEQATHFQVPHAAQVVIIQPQPPPTVGADPCFISCPHCHVKKLTRVEYAPSVRTHFMAALLCIVGLWCCACLPYTATSCMNANHFCGNCNKYVGFYSGD